MRQASLAAAKRSHPLPGDLQLATELSSIDLTLSGRIPINCCTFPARQCGLSHGMALGTPRASHLRRRHDCIPAQPAARLPGARSGPHTAGGGKLTRVVGLTLEAIGCRAAIGSLCRIDTQDGALEAEVVGFSGDRLFLMPSEQLKGVIPGARVVPVTEDHGIPVGMNLLGRVIDGIGQPWTGWAPSSPPQTVQFAQHRINPLARRPIHPADGRGGARHQRRAHRGPGPAHGLFAGSGVGKSVLLGMMTRGSVADVVVVGLIGEQGREVKEFIEEILGAEGRERAVVVAAPPMPPR